MASPRSLQLLELILSGHHLSVTELDDLIVNRVEEDLYVEYKHGDELQNSDANETMRKYLSAFANSSGGILILGINAPQRVPIEITGCNRHGKGKLDDWAARCLTPIASHFAPQPFFQIVGHPKGEILVCAVERSLGLVPITENGGIVYYFRLHDQTLKAPDYFIADLLLGRRQQPVFEVGLFKALNFSRINDDEINSLDLSFEIRFGTENASIAWADDSQWGIIFWAQRTFDPHQVRSDNPSQHLLSYLNVVDKTFQHPKPKRLIHYHGSLSISKPFDTDTKLIHLAVPLRVEDKWFSYTWKAAFYFLARNCLPMWYQTEFTIDANTVQLVDKHEDLVSPQDTFYITRMWSQRPTVAWEENNKKAA